MLRPLRDDLDAAGEAGRLRRGRPCRLRHRRRTVGERSTALIGGSDDADSLGAAWVFVRAGTSWLGQSKLVAVGAEGQPSIGYSVALSGDGDTALLGGPGDSDLSGAAWVFTRSNGDWYQQGDKLTVPGATGQTAVGYAVALSADGGTALLGAPYDNAFVGGAFVFGRSGATWSQQGGELTGSGETGQGFFGVSVSLAADGGTALIGADTDNGSTGAAFTFARSAGSWSQQGGKITGSGATSNAMFGFDVALAGDGASALIGALEDDGGNGAAWQFGRDGTTWIQQGGKLTGGGEFGAAAFGTAVALSAAGDTALVGALADDDDTGATWVFVGPPTVAPPPVAPTNVGAAPGLGRATVTFSPSPGATAYTVTASPGGATAAGASSPIVVTGLDAGTLYTFTVTASNAAGAGAPSAASNAIRTFGTPGPPTSVAATSRDGAAEVTVDAPADDGGTPVLYYTATASPGGRSASGSGAITVGGLENGVAYTFTVTATNAVGTGGRVVAVERGHPDRRKARAPGSTCRSGAARHPAVHTAAGAASPAAAFELSDATTAHLAARSRATRRRTRVRSRPGRTGAGRRGPPPRRPSSPAGRARRRSRRRCRPSPSRRAS